MLKVSLIKWIQKLHFICLSIYITCSPDIYSFYTVIIKGPQYKRTCILISHNIRGEKKKSTLMEKSILVEKSITYLKKIWRGNWELSDLFYPEKQYIMLSPLIYLNLIPSIKTLIVSAPKLPKFYVSINVRYMRSI